MPLGALHPAAYRPHQWFPSWANFDWTPDWFSTFWHPWDPWNPCRFMSLSRGGRETLYVTCDTLTPSMARMAILCDWRNTVYGEFLTNQTFIRLGNGVVYARLQLQAIKFTGVGKILLNHSTAIGNLETRGWLKNMITKNDEVLTFGLRAVSSTEKSY